MVAGEWRRLDVRFHVRRGESLDGNGTVYYPEKSLLAEVICIVYGDLGN